MNSKMFFKTGKKSKVDIMKMTWLTPKYPKKYFSILHKSISIVAKQVSIVDTNQTCFMQTKLESRISTKQCSIDFKFYI
jgi:hypothetical protein